MPVPTHRLDLVVVPTPPDRWVDLAPLLARWSDRGLLTDGAAELVPGGVARVRVDRPDGVVLYANRQGGFRVGCPRCAANLVPAFSAAMRSWRAGGPRACACPACRVDLPLESLEFAPAAAFGRTAMVFHDVAAPTLTDAARADLDEAVGTWRIVLRRG